MKNALEKLHDAIAYPDEMQPGDATYTFRVDGSDVHARLQGGRLLLSSVIDKRDESLQQLSSYAMGRLLKEEAVLAWDERIGACVLWQDIPEAASPAELKEFFEHFLNSCDWWRARAVEAGAPPVAFPDIVIRP